MRPRLFWKILFGFWLTFLGITEGVWVIVALFGGPHRHWEAEMTARLAAAQLTAAATALRHGGLPALEELRDSWPEAERTRLSVRALGPDQAGTTRDEAGQATEPLAEPDVEVSDDRSAEPARETPAASRQTAVVRIDGRPAYRLSYNVTDLLAKRWKPGPLDVPPPLLALGLAGGLLFSSLLAWYLTRPVLRLRDGFEQLAQGRLHVRLTPSMGRRRDEIADLARDFDLMAERLQLAVASREQLLHDVSHELRSPLTRLHMATGLARQNPQRIQAALQRIERETQRLDELVGGLLTLSRVEAGAVVQEDYFDLPGLVEAIVDDARFEARASGVSVEARIATSDPQATASPTMHGNAELIRRAVENVIRNALHHSASGQRVIIDTRLDASRNLYHIQVVDQGPGVPPQQLDSIFEPFVRLQGSLGHPGFGLGLSIAKRAIAAHGGGIEARNRPEGGLEVGITLPFSPLAIG